jgi:CDP-diacylglycerol--glycerol-3-phosphate 3-phosphatidyltransferase
MMLYLYPDYFSLTPQTLPFVMLALLSVAELSDMLDGWIARNFNQVTEIGKLIDPLADSVWRTSLFLSFTAQPIFLPMWIVFLFLLRDSAISTLRTLCALKGHTLAARFSGKLKAVLQGTSAFIIVSLMIPFSQGSLSQEDLTFISTVISLGVGSWSLISGVDYVIAMQPYLKKHLSCES